MPSEPAGGGESDPLIPESDQPSDSSSDIFSDEQAAASAAEQAEASSESGSAGSPDDMMMEPETTGGASGGESAVAEAASQGQSGMPGGEGSPAEGGGSAGSPGSPGSPEMDPAIAEQIEAAREALEQAGIALQTAGETLETATTDAELAEAETALGKARLAVIVAGQDLMDIQDIFEGTPAQGDLEAAEDSLNEANVAIVIATDSIFSSRIELPDFDPANAGGATGGESELEKELNESIAIFEGRIIDARKEVMGSTPPPKGNENVPGVAVLGGGSLEEGNGTFEENADISIDTDAPELVQQGRMPEGGDIAAVEGATPPVPEDIPDPQGDDIVAQQLREAAIAETDPALREKLWEEYRRYKASL